MVEERISKRTNLDQNISVLSSCFDTLTVTQFQIEGKGCDRTPGLARHMGIKSCILISLINSDGITDGPASNSGWQFRLVHAFDVFSYVRSDSCSSYLSVTSKTRLYCKKPLILSPPPQTSFVRASRYVSRVFSPFDKKTTSSSRRACMLQGGKK